MDLHSRHLGLGLGLDFGYGFGLAALQTTFTSAMWKSRPRQGGLPAASSSSVLTRAVKTREARRHNLLPNARSLELDTHCWPRAVAKGGSSLWIRERTPTNNYTCEYIVYSIYLIYVHTRMQLFVYGPTVKSEVSFDFCRGTRVGER